MEYINFEWDEMAIVIGDTGHSGEEDRFIILGFSRAANLLVVCHCYRESDTVIRIISARKQSQVKRSSMMTFERGVDMKEEYDFSNGKRNPYVKRLKKQITINIDNETINFFKEQSEGSGIPYQTLINLYLTDCAKQKKQLQISWK